jgi:hypothetical protein
MVGASGGCAGTLILGKRVYYQSHTDFHGADRVVYVVVIGGGQSGRKVVLDITVR